MALLGEFCLFSKAKSMISSLSAGIIMLWTSGSLSPIQTPKVCSPPDLDQYLQLGLKTLIYPQPYHHQNPAIAYHHHHPEVLQSYMVLNSSTPPPPPTPLSLLPSQILDDLIGTDSGVYMITSSNYDQQANNGICNKWNSQRQRVAKEERHYPPPIPLLAQTGNLVGRMPWILTRHYVDGRLILRRQRVQHHEYFQTLRENGRLILNLVTMECDDDDEEEEEEYDQDHQEYFEEVVGENNYYSSSPLQFSEEVEDHDDDKFIMESENEDDHDHDRWMNGGGGDADDTSTTDQVMVLESVLSHELSYLENYAISTTYTYACGMLMMDFHERSRLYSSQPSSSPLQPMATVIM